MLWFQKLEQKILKATCYVNNISATWFKAILRSSNVSFSPSALAATVLYLSLNFSNLQWTALFFITLLPLTFCAISFQMAVTISNSSVCVDFSSVQWTTYQKSSDVNSVLRFDELKDIFRSISSENNRRRDEWPSIRHRKKFKCLKWGAFGYLVCSELNLSTNRITSLCLRHQRDV